MRQRTSKGSFASSDGTSRARRRPARPSGPPETGRGRFARPAAGLRGALHEEAPGAGLPAAGSWLILGENALAVSGAQEEPEPVEVIGQRLGSLALDVDAEIARQGRGEVVAVGLHPASEELQQPGKLDG